MLTETGPRAWCGRDRRPGLLHVRVVEPEPAARIALACADYETAMVLDTNGHGCRGRIRTCIALVNS